MNINQQGIIENAWNQDRSTKLLTAAASLLAVATLVLIAFQSRLGSVSFIALATFSGVVILVTKAILTQHESSRLRDLVKRRNSDTLPRTYWNPFKKINLIKS